MERMQWSRAAHIMLLGKKERMWGRYMDICQRHNLNDLLPPMRHHLQKFPSLPIILSDF
jgi:hypothetical protein